LGPVWSRRTPAERAEFAGTFTEVFEHAYLRMGRALLPRDRPPAIRVLGEDREGEDEAVVRTIVEARDGRDVRVNYTMSHAGEGWRVQDVVVEGVSVVETYQAQFKRILRQSTFGELIARAPSGGRHRDGGDARGDTEGRFSPRRRGRLFRQWQPGTERGGAA
jgi:phospholipid transport system substrate-binding protein